MFLVVFSLLIELKLKFVIERLYLFVFISSFVELKESIIEQFVIFLLLLLFKKKVLLLDNKVFEAFIVERVIESFLFEFKYCFKFNFLIDESLNETFFDLLILFELLKLV